MAWSMLLPIDVNETTFRKVFDMIRQHFDLFSVLLFASLLSPVLAQDYPVQEELRVNLIELDVKVLDWRGKYISGLTAEDFEIREQGELQAIDKLEEIQLDRLPEAELVDYKSRVMILLDYQNSQFKTMRYVFDELREFAKFNYDSFSEIGLAINVGGIAMISDFTSDPEEFLKAVDIAQKNYRFTSYRPTDIRHFENQVEMLGQFVRYVGAYTGKKNLILVTEQWKTNDRSGRAFSGLDSESGVDSEKVTSLKDIQTVCMNQKISINVLKLLHPSGNLPDISTPGVGRISNSTEIDWTSTLATATSGYLFRANVTGIREMVDRAIDLNEQYYRIRYYSNYSGEKYRKVKVNAKGIGRFAYTFSGYFPGQKEISQQDAHADMNVISSKAVDLKMGTDWMRYERSGWRKKTARYVVSHRLYDTNGLLAVEKVVPGEVEIRKENGDYFKAPVERRFSFDLSDQTKPGRLETEVTDLTTGKKVQFEHRWDAIYKPSLNP